MRLEKSQVEVMKSNLSYPALKQNGSFKSNILLIDDHDENLIGLQNLLEEKTRTFLIAHDGDLGIEIARQHDIWLILLDIQMPGITGFEVAELLKADVKTRNIPIIFLTAMDRDLKHALKGFEEGAVDFINKPVNPDLLRAKVNVFLRLERQRREIEMQNRQLQKLGMMVEHSADLMCILDKETLGFEEINPALKKLLGYSPGELIGSKLTELFSELKDVLGFEYSLLHYQTRNTPDMHFECLFKSKDGSLKWFSLNVTQHFNKWFVNGQDITRIKDMEARLRTYNKDLEQLSGIIAHEIKTPLKSGASVMNLLRKESLTSAALEKLDRVDEFMEKAERMLDDLQNYSLGQDGHDFEMLSGEEIIREAMDNLQPELNSTQAVVHYPNISQVYGIRPLLVILFQNLLSNSLKSCHGRKPEIEITFTEMNEKAIFIYKDNGEGVIRKYADLFFESRDANPLQYRGVDLKICNMIMKRHGGSIQPDPTPGEGTTFYLFFMKRK